MKPEYRIVPPALGATVLRKMGAFKRKRRNPATFAGIGVTHKERRPRKRGRRLSLLIKRLVRRQAWPNIVLRNSRSRGQFALIPLDRNRQADQRVLQDGIHAVNRDQLQ